MSTEHVNHQYGWESVADRNSRYVDRSDRPDDEFRARIAAFEGDEMMHAIHCCVHCLHSPASHQQWGKGRCDALDCRCPRYVATPPADAPDPSPCLCAGIAHLHPSGAPGCADAPAQQDDKLVTPEHPDVASFLAIQTIHSDDTRPSNQRTVTAGCGCVLIISSCRPIYRCSLHFANDFTRAARPSADTETLRRVRELHQQQLHDDGEPAEFCAHDGMTWPCRTRVALDAP